MADELKIIQVEAELKKLQEVEQPTLAVKILIFHAQELLKSERSK